MFLQLSARLVIIAGALLPWIFSYLLARRGPTWLRAWKDWLKRIAILLFAVSAICYLTGKIHISSLFSVYGWGFFVASNWLQNRYKFEHPAAPTVLNIPAHETTGAPR